MSARGWLRAASGAMLLASLAVIDLALNRDDVRCRGGCYGAAPSSRYGSSTYEPGHPWTTYADSWQWSAQSALAHVALLAAIIAFGLSLTDFRNPKPALAVAVVALAGWIAWAALSPPIPAS